MRRSSIPSFALIVIVKALLAPGVASAAEDQSVSPRANHVEGEAPAAPAEAERMVILVSAPDGPTPETHASVDEARASGVQSILLKLENVGLIQDDDLMELIRDELYDILGQRGYSQSDITLVECPGSCAADSMDDGAGSL